RAAAEPAPGLAAGRLKGGKHELTEQEQMEGQRPQQRLFQVFGGVLVGVGRHFSGCAGAS
ncbi:MAG: hypothetical protein WAR21_03665, partial [Candidatus Acidiferrales bacterium]